VAVVDVGHGSLGNPNGLGDHSLDLSTDHVQLAQHAFELARTQPLQID
jgi:hypothetical protein